MTIWTSQPGAIVTRSEVRAELGGSPQGGIITTKKAPYILIYTDRSAGVRHGYTRDGWRPDGGFDYTGAGRLGDQVMKRGNRAILEHRTDDKRLLVFESTSAQNRGEKLHRYLGEFELDKELPYRWETDRDSQGDERQVIVFNLRPVGPSAVNDSGHAPVELAGVDDPDQGPAEDAARPTAPEDGEGGEFERKGSAPGTGERKEAELEKKFRAWLGSHGHHVARYRLPMGTNQGDLLTDTFDQTTRILYEAKSSSKRHNIRLALGQLLDYKRFIPGGVAGTAILVPERPAPDLLALLQMCGVGFVVEEGLGFDVVLPAVEARNG